MHKRRLMIWTIAVAAVIALLLGVYFYLEFGEKADHKKAVSIIVYGNDSERWENLRSGAEQAADKLSAEVNLVTMSDELDVKEQKKLLHREIDNGADALMVAACDSAGMKKEIVALSEQIPILMVESGIGNSGVEERGIVDSEIGDGEESLTISADNYDMGRKLGETVLNKEIPLVKVAIICDHENRDSVKQRYQGVEDALTGNVDSVVRWDRKDNEQDIRAMLFLQRELIEEAVDVVVALDTSSTEAIIDAVKNLGKNVKIYGIGNSDKAIYHLDNGTMEALGYQNEFSIGYIGVKQLLDDTSYKQQEYQKMIEFQVVTKKDMYDTDHQKMLFPFVK